jgi:hypothetical protein
MAHFAKLNNDNTVTEVIVVNNDVIMDDEGKESESIGIVFCQSLYGADTKWVQTSYNGSFRKNYAGVGFSWDGTGFAAPQPFESWTLNQDTYLWESPIPKPTDGSYSWNEADLMWEKVISPTE